MNRTGNWRRLVAALVVGTGIATIWVAIGVWGITLAESWLQRVGESVHESVVVAVDGTPLIQSRSLTNTSYRSLAGEPLAVEREEWLSPASLATAIRPPGLFHVPIGWGQLLGLSDEGRPPVAWYLIRNNERQGRAYFVGYDELSRQLVGYIGRNGFRRGLPPESDWFDMGLHQLSWGTRVVASSGYLNYGSRGYSYGAAADGMPLPPWHVFLMDGQRLLEIDLRQRTLRSLYEADDMLSVGMLTEAPANVGEADESAAGNVRAQSIRRVVLRTTERLIVIDPPTDGVATFALPESLRAEHLDVYGLPEQLLLQWRSQRVPIDSDPQLVWLETDGTIARQEQVALIGYRQSNERLQAWIIAGVAPISVGWAAVHAILAPLAMVQANQAANFTEAFARIFNVAWPPLVAVFVLAVVLAWWTSRLQARYHRPATGAWCAFVLLLGVPGFIAYWLEHRRAKLEACGACGQIVPRDREACAACEAVFAAPALVGTEIFA